MTIYHLGTTMSEADYTNLKNAQRQEGEQSKARTLALYSPSGKHEMPPHHLPAGITDPATWTRRDWLDNLEAGDFLGSSLPLQYAPEGVQGARKRMDEAHSKLTALDELCEALCADYHGQGEDVKAAMKLAVLDGKEPGEKAKAVEAKRVATATKYKDAVLRRDAFYGGLEDLYGLVAAETAKGLPAWHDSMNKAVKELAAKAAPVLAESSKALTPIMREALALTGHVEAARKGLGAEGVAPEALTDIAAVSRTLGALEAAPVLWDNMAADPVLSMTAAQYATAHEAPFDWKAHESREAAIEAFRQHYKVFGQQAMTREQAAAFVDGKADLAPFGHSL
ncbi:hypothetical protein [Streptomyces sp. NPDC059918]|uniref:hypothetical protein n=1 Tax=unclassified Streptomyces TaxID=2593676 RepID=UPI00364FAB7C